MGDRRSKFRTRRLQQVNSTISQQPLLLDTYELITNIEEPVPSIPNMFQTNECHFQIDQNEPPNLLIVSCYDGDIILPPTIFRTIFINQESFHIPSLKSLILQAISPLLFNRPLVINDAMEKQNVEMLLIVLPFIKQAPSVRFIASLIQYIRIHESFFEESVEVRIVELLIETNNNEGIQTVLKYFKSTKSIEMIIAYLIKEQKNNFQYYNDDQLLVVGRYLIENKNIFLFKHIVTECISRNIQSVGVLLWKLWKVYPTSIESGLLNWFVTVVQTFKNEEVDIMFLITVEDVIQFEEYFTTLSTVMSEVVLIMNERPSNTILFHCVNILSQYSGTIETNTLMINNGWFECVLKNINGHMELSEIGISMIFKILTSLSCCQDGSNNKCLLEGSLLTEVMLTILSKKKNEPHVVCDILQSFEYLTSHNGLNTTVVDCIVPSLFILSHEYEDDNTIIKEILTIINKVVKLSPTTVDLQTLLRINALCLKYMEDIVIVVIISEIYQQLCKKNINLCEQATILNIICIVLKTYSSSPEHLNSIIQCISTFYVKSIGLDYLHSEGTITDVYMALKLVMDNNVEFDNVEKFAAECCYIIAFAAQNTQEVDLLDAWVHITKQVAMRFPKSIKAQESSNVVFIVLSEISPTKDVLNDRKSTRQLHTIFRSGTPKNAIDVFELIHENAQLFDDEISVLVTTCLSYISEHKKHKLDCLSALIKVFQQHHVSETLAQELIKQQFITRTNQQFNSNLYQKVYLIVVQALIQTIAYQNEIAPLILHHWEVFLGNNKIVKIVQKSKDLNQMIESFNTFKDMNCIQTIVFLYALLLQDKQYVALSQTLLKIIIQYIQNETNQTLDQVIMLLGYLIDYEILQTNEDFLGQLIPIIIKYLKNKEDNQTEYLTLYSLQHLVTSSHLKKFFLQVDGMNDLHIYFDGNHDIKLVEMAKRLIETLSN
ncbi:Uncharacterized protein QTN25_006002 [Entamoeba marina]